MSQKLRCTKNLVLGNQVVIMKHDIIELLDSDFIEDESEGGGMRWFDINVEISNMCEGMELSISILQLAEYFEYIDYRTRYITCKNK